MRIGFVQFNPLLCAVEHNLKTIEELVSSTTADLLVLPELALTGYAIPDTRTLRQLSEPPDGPHLRGCPQRDLLSGRGAGEVRAGLERPARADLAPAELGGRLHLLQRPGGHREPGRGDAVQHLLGRRGREAQVRGLDQEGEGQRGRGWEPPRGHAEGRQTH